MMPGITDVDLQNRFTYHAPERDQTEHYERIRSECLGLARTIVDLTPGSREQSLALTKLDEVCMWANASIARNG